MTEKGKDTKFEVELKGLNLPAEVEQRINTELQQTVLREIARIDTEGDRKVNVIFQGCGINRTWGIVIIGDDFPQ
jgi:hypothetical protein